MPHGGDLAGRRAKASTVSILASVLYQRLLRAAWSATETIFLPGKRLSPSCRKRHDGDYAERRDMPHRRSSFE